MLRTCFLSATLRGLSPWFTFWFVQTSHPPPQLAAQPFRFSYAKVKPNAYGLDVSDILTGDDDELRRRVSMKFVAAPYRDSDTPRHLQRLPCPASSRPCPPFPPPHIHAPDTTTCSLGAQLREGGILWGQAPQ